MFHHAFLACYNLSTHQHLRVCWHHLTNFSANMSQRAGNRDFLGQYTKYFIFGHIIPCGMHYQNEKAKVNISESVGENPVNADFARCKCQCKFLHAALMKKAFHEIWKYRGARSAKTKDDNVLNNSHISATLTLLNMAGRLR